MTQPTLVVPHAAQGTPRNPSQRLARTILALLLIGLGLFVLSGFLRALVWAGILAIATWPLYTRVRLRMPHAHPVLLPLLFTLGSTLIVLVPLILMGFQVAHEARVVAGLVRDARADGLPLPETLAHLPAFQDQVATWWQANLTDPAGARALLGRIDTELLAISRSLGARVLHSVVLFVFTLVTLFFLYRSGDALGHQALHASNRLFGRHGEALARQVIASIHGTVDGLVLVGLGVGAILGVGYVLAGVPHPALLGAATAVGALIPMGAPVILAVASLLVLGAGKALMAGLLFAGGMVVIFIADHAIRPGLIGGATRLPFLWVLLGILGGVEAFGLLGLFVGPATMAVLILLWRDWVGDATNAAQRP